jgi:hypothetical protein
MLKLAFIADLLKDDTIRKKVLRVKCFGCVDIWELNPERLASLCLKASETVGVTIFAQNLHDWER